MAIKAQLKDQNGNAVYPVTSSALVGMSDGSGSLDSKLASLGANLNHGLVFDKFQKHDDYNTHNYAPSSYLGICYDTGDYKFYAYGEVVNQFGYSSTHYYTVWNADDRHGSSIEYNSANDGIDGIYNLNGADFLIVKGDVALLDDIQLQFFKDRRNNLFVKLPFFYHNLRLDFYQYGTRRGNRRTDHRVSIHPRSYVRLTYTLISKTEHKLSLVKGQIGNRLLIYSVAPAVSNLNLAEYFKSRISRLVDKDGVETAAIKIRWGGKTRIIYRKDTWKCQKDINLFELRIGISLRVGYYHDLFKPKIVPAKVFLTFDGNTNADNSLFWDEALETLKVSIKPLHGAYWN